MQKNKKNLRLLGIVLLALATLVAYTMQQRYANGLLWGYRPLFFYLFAYGGLLGVFFRFSSAEDDHRDFKVAKSPEKEPSSREVLSSFTHSLPTTNNLKLGYATVAGVLLGLGFPGYVPFPFFLLVAFVPLLVVQRQLLTTGASSWRVFFYGWHAFLLYNILATYWVTNTAFAPGLLAVVANSLLMSIPWVLFHRVARALPKVAYLSLLAFWLTFEWMHYHWDLNWPWLALGNGFAQFPALVQWYEYVGTPGGTLWILGVNCVVYLTFFAPPAKPTIWRSPFTLLGLVAVPLGFSLVRYYTYTAPAGEVISVGAIQPNFEPHFEKFASNAQTQLDTFIPLTQAAVQAAGHLDYILYPETSFSRIEEDAVLASPTVSRLQSALGDLNLDYLVTGYDGYYIFKPGDERTKATRRIPRANGEVLELEAINGTFQLDLKSGDIQTYRKGVFVPGAESFPFREVLWFAKPLVDQLGGSTEGRASQEERTALIGKKANIAPVICYESVFGDYFTDYITEGAQAIFVMTNDGWWDHTAGYRQHLYFSSLRAIETRRAVVRSANVGACAFIDQRGKIVSQTAYDQMGFLNGTLQLNDKITLYVRLGDFLARIAGLLSIMLLASALTRRVI